MDLTLGLAGLITVALALGHETLGRVWVLPQLTEEHLARTPFGPRSMTLATLRATWHILTVFALGMGTLLIALAWGPGTDPQTLLLRWLAAMWLGAAAVAVFAGTRLVRKPRDFLRLPVPVFFVAVAALCWRASL
jgi:hypothetical protein